ncbi:MAG TPA: ATP-binding protein [Candidatus Acidoferrales bacterium]|nr:ATP-binding protein [Candidatus Acidoferrales bacterium]
MSQRAWTQKLWLAVGGLSVVLLAAAIFTLGSLNAPVHPQQSDTLALLYALSAFMFLAFLVFSLILIRSLVRLGADRRAGQLGSRFKTKMVFGAMGISLLPIVFLFLFSYSLVNRTLNLWFPKPLEIANTESQRLFDEVVREFSERMNDRAGRSVAQLQDTDANGILEQSGSGPASKLDAVWIIDPHQQITQVAPANLGPDHLRKARLLPSGAEIWQTDADTYIIGSAPFPGGTLYVGRKLRPDFLAQFNSIEAETRTYQQQRQDIRLYKNQILLALALITVLLLFSTTWAALFLSKQVTVPIQALAEATQEISRGNFDHRVTLQAQDELGTLIGSFNDMAAQLDEGRRQINEFTRNIQQAFEERERRRKLMEAILENIPTGVLSLDASGKISRVNSAVAAIFGEAALSAQSLSDLFGEEAARLVTSLMRRSLRMGAASREIEIATSGRLVRTAVTVSSLGPRRSNPGYVVVIDDLTELLRAQKAAAWQEVAQRIAHEIKNPLTPIVLSAQRLKRYLERFGRSSGPPQRLELESLVAECAGLIEREVHTLESLVDEFSQFARFPSARLAPSDLNSIVSSALGLFKGRLEGLTLQTNLAPRLPVIKADAELLRRVIVNLVDNAAEAMEGSTVRRLQVATRAGDDGDAVELEISDTGHGISPEDKDRLFLPHFSTKERGTGLGLAIVSRIVAEHNGSLRVEDNNPVGARFLLRFPAADAVAPAADRAGTESESLDEAVDAPTGIPTDALDD